MMVTSSKTTSMVPVNIGGPTVESTMVSGSTIKWKAKELLHGATVGDMSETISMIKSMDKVPSNGQMVENISVNGAKENNMARVSTSRKVKRGRESGRWVRESSGSKITILNSKPDHRTRFFHD